MMNLSKQVTVENNIWPLNGYFYFNLDIDSYLEVLDTVADVADVVDLHANGIGNGDECNLSQKENLPFILNADVLNVLGKSPELDRSRVGVVGGVSNSRSSSPSPLTELEPGIIVKSSLVNWVNSFPETSPIIADVDDLIAPAAAAAVTATAAVDAVLEEVIEDDDEDVTNVDDEDLVTTDDVLLLLVTLVLVDVDIELVDDWDSSLTPENLADLLIICFSILLLLLFFSSNLINLDYLLLLLFIK